MIVEPDQRVADFAKAGADIISVHVESKATTHLDRVIHQVPFCHFSSVSIQPVSLVICKNPQVLLHFALWSETLWLCRTQIKDLGCKAGVVLNPATPLSAIEHVLSFVGELCFATVSSHRPELAGNLQ